MSLRLRAAAALAVPRNLPPDTRHRVVKSIRAQHMVEWIVANWHPTVVVCRRHPLDVVASRMEMTDQPPAVSVATELRNEARRRYGIEIPAVNDEVAVQAWRVGMQMSVLHERSSRTRSFTPSITKRCAPIRSEAFTRWRARSGSTGRPRTKRC